MVKLQTLLSLFTKVSGERVKILALLKSKGIYSLTDITLRICGSYGYRNSVLGTDLDELRLWRNFYLPEAMY